jgi:hypothetical protein
VPSAPDRALILLTSGFIVLSAVFSSDVAELWGFERGALVFLFLVAIALINLAVQRTR